ncbi:hypothetical protein J4E83_008845 [Alternaria metachromatica]|uniref:uncharacterized protein n=1 Tax=Alternaria metachromatica TaxID=283354 RepID=UPI0020C53F87|nr:uncharacterized protein J4E83_008845 [Alternaria metachromatica]KAI4609203.1 hypothetical protein J4E83_008845 [Alternaria metachromatica]
MASKSSSTTETTNFSNDSVAPHSTPQWLNELEPEGPECSDYFNEFKRWCISKDISWLYPPDRAPFTGFIKEMNLRTYPEDPEGYPGFHHAFGLFVRYYKARNGNPPGKLTMMDMCTLLDMLNSKFASTIADERFAIDGKVTGDKAGEKWRIASKLQDVDGSFNRGIYLVHNENNPDNSAQIMKTLPLPRDYLGFAERELDILGTLQHDKVIKFFDGTAPKSIHDTAWMITEYCNKGTLFDFLAKYAYEAKLPVPELFVWNILESLVHAAVYLHYGPNVLEKFEQQEPEDGCLEAKEDASWDVVYHRDIILSNVFITSSTGDKTEYPIVKLGDFGCAMRQSEISTLDQDKYPKAEETPRMDPAYVPPEGQYGTKAVDVYQIGRLTWCVVQNVVSPTCLDEKAMLPENFETSEDAPYSRELRRILYSCTRARADLRIDSLPLLSLVRDTRKRLISENRLPFVELYISFVERLSEFLEFAH